MATKKDIIDILFTLVMVGLMIIGSLVDNLYVVLFGILVLNGHISQKLADRIKVLEDKLSDLENSVNWLNVTKADEKQKPY
jgi:hypothetical protein